MCHHISNICPTLQVSYKYNYVATVVAEPNLPATGAFLSQLHCHFQWHEGSQVETHINVSFVKGNPQDSIKAWIALVLSMKPSVYVTSVF